MNILANVLRCHVECMLVLCAMRANDESIACGSINSEDLRELHYALALLFHSRCSRCAALSIYLLCG